MKQINIYYQATTKVSMAHLIVDDNEDIETYLKLWIAQGYCKAHLSSNKVTAYIPWANIVWCQCSN
jgi:hypothetical protein